MPKSNKELLGSFITEYSVKNKNGADIPVYSVSNDKGFCRDYFSKDVSSKDKTSYKIVPRGCFAYNPSRINVGSIAWQNKEDAVIVSPLYVVFSTKGLNNDFLMYYLKSNALMSYIKVYSAGSVRNNLRFKTLSSFPVKIPSLEQQARIVAELDCLTGIIEKKKQQLEELDKLAQSIFYDMFGDPITNEKGWKVKVLNDVCSHITDGDHMPPPKAETGIPFITISNIDKVSRSIVFDDTFFVAQEYYDNLKDERKAKEGDLLYTVTGSYGIPVVVSGNDPFCFQRHIALIRPQQKEIRTVFLCYWALSRSVKQMADTAATGIAQKTVGLNSIRRFPIIIPEQSIQDAFAKKIEAIEKQKRLVKQSIVETETLFNSRMDFWFNN